MNTRLFLPPAIALFLLALLAAPASAQALPSPNPDEIGSIYLGNSQVLAALHPRLLTKNARVVQFICAPTGTRVAYISETAGPAGVLASLGVVTTKDGEDTTYLSADMPASNDAIGNAALIQGLEGWSDDAAYLAFEETVVDNASSGQTPIDRLACVDLVHGNIVQVPLPFDQLPPAPDGSTPSLLYENFEGAAWAPGARALAYGVHARLSDGRDAYCLCLFDADRRTTRLLLSMDKGWFAFVGWQDSSHLVYKVNKSYFICDLATGKPTPVATLPKLMRSAIAPWSPAQADTKLPSGNGETLALSQTDDSSTNADGDRTDDTTVWITRTGGPPKPSALELDAFPRATGRDQPQFLPNAGFDRQNTYHAVYVSDGDLKIVDIAPRGATTWEKIDAGEKISCEEEIPIAESDARQVGLGILQWAADNNETFPAGEGFHDEVYPYIKSDAVFTSPNGVHFTYLPPSDPKLADMQSPADTPLGKFELPCASVVLYGDGHVKVQDKEPGE